MTTVLKTSADRAEACASIFLRFKDYTPSATQSNVTNVVTELFGLSRSLQRLREALNSPSLEIYKDEIADDQETVIKSIQHTLRHVEERLAPLEEMHERRLNNERQKQETYRKTWQTVQEHFSNEGAQITGCESLTSRLDTYRLFVDDLHSKLSGDSTSRRFKDMQYRMGKLLRVQVKTLSEESITSRIARLAIETAAIPSFKKQLSWERRRPRKDDDLLDDDDEDDTLDRLEEKIERLQQQQKRERKLDEDRLERIDRLEQKHKRDKKLEEERLDRLEREAELEKLRRKRLEKLAVSSKRAEKPARKVIKKSIGSDRKVYYPQAPGAFGESDQEFDYTEIVESDDGFEDVNVGELVGWELESEDMADVFAPPPSMAPRVGYRVNYPSPYAVVNETAAVYLVAAPEPPRSTSSGTMSPSILDSESGSEITEKHWAAVVFGLPRPSTQFRSTGSESGCFGDHMPGITAKLKPDHEDLLKLPFENGNLMLKVVIRERDKRSRLLVRQDRNARKILSCQPITSLRIIRHDSNLQLCLPEKQGRVMLWTQLNFPTYERLVLFWCTFHALKSQDVGRPVSRLEDAVLHGEECLYSTVISDDNFQHAFHVLRDKDSRGLRLQASVLTGPLKRTPIWTAFITHQIQSTTWVRQPEPRKVHLRELTRYVFTEEYEPQVSPRGEGELYFMNSKDAKRFYQIIDDIATGAI